MKIIYLILALFHILTVVPLSGQKVKMIPMTPRKIPSATAVKPGIQGVKPQGAPGDNKPKEEPVFLTWFVISDMAGSMWVNNKSYTLEENKGISIPVPMQVNYYFLSADSTFEIAYKTEKFQLYNKGTIDTLNLLVRSRYQQYLKALSIQEEEDAVLNNLYSNMLSVGESDDLEMNRVEITVAEYAAFQKSMKIAGKIKPEDELKPSRVLNSHSLPGSEWTLMPGADWRDDIFGNELPEHDYWMPVVNVSWYEAVAFCEWLTEKDPYYIYRLPTVAEWERAAASGSYTNYPWGEDTTIVANFANTADYSLWPKYGNGRSAFRISKSVNDNHDYTSPVGYYIANYGGFFDMIGNVSEWCSDNYIDRSSMGKELRKSLKGGSFADHIKECTIEKTFAENPEKRSAKIGFRVCRELKITPSK